MEVTDITNQITDDATPHRQMIIRLWYLCEFVHLAFIIARREELTHI